MKPSPDEVRLFREHPLLSRLSDAAFAALFAAAQPVRVHGGQVLFRQGDVADAFYLVRAGAVEIAVDDAVVTTVTAGECFGERGFDPAQGGRRTAGARVAVASELLRVPGRVFTEEVAPQLFAAAPAVDHLRDDLAALLGVAWADAPASTTSVQQIAAGTVVFREGDAGDAAWFVIEGLLQVEREGVIVDRIGPGESPARDRHARRPPPPRAPPGTRRRLDHRDDRLISVTIAGDLDAAAALAERLRGDRPLTRGELERFRWSGELGAPARGERRLLCGCVGLPGPPPPPAPVEGCVPAPAPAACAADVCR
ncbi:MAG: cyclic nucleotide-binding domain-containing protein [Nannocystis sp.]|uniref:cyclic nucleotide-binding domain-containing protein n=1 Tax=Nannocystis sp. TaxID=1962667 RepID=UPI002420C82A|nr:cyclic nucleotide-binding domain-containing protein [Nannocystis sp.]MBK9756388.1 cyclic nucleotide-binding domain-containing protein [Nannocystis sp.]